MKKKYILIQIVIILLSIGLMPLNLFVIAFPEWVTIVFSLFSVLSLVLFYLKANGKLASKIILTGITVLSVALIIFASYCTPYWNCNFLRKYSYTEDYNKKLTFDQAKADTDFMMKYLNKDHPVFLNGEPADIKNAYNKSIAALRNNPNITVSYLNQQLENILSPLHDGHTAIYGCYKNRHYLKTAYSRNQNGYRLVKINGISINDLFTQKSNFFSYDYKSFGISELTDCLSTLEGLDYLGIDANGVKYTYISNTEKADTEVYKVSDFLTLDEYYSYNKIKEGSKRPFVSYKIYQNKNAAVLTLKSCDYNNEYKNCLNAMFKKIKAKNIKNIAIDLRGNGGGNSLVADEFMRYINVNSYKEGSEVWRMGCFMIPINYDTVKNNKYKGLTFDGNVYVLTSVDTFSSAMLFSEFIQDNKLGTIIGEAPGEKPSGYGEVAPFTLPNSKLYFQVSSKKFYRIDKNSKLNQIIPDIKCSSKKALDIFFKTIKVRK